MKTVQILNPLELISNILEKSGYGKNVRVGHIEYDKNVNSEYQYHVIETTSHDGTMLFSQQAIDKALLRLVNKQTAYKLTLPEDKEVKDVSYTVGDVKLESEFGEVDLPSGKHAGVKETIKIPVRCEYVL
ncbi:hypothetical protein ACU3L3_07365 [Priestia endophytica]